MTKSTEQVVQFGELPPGPSSRRGDSHWPAIANALSARPGMWAKVASKPNRNAASTCVTQIRKGFFSGMPRGEYEAERRDNDVWARYVGEAQS